MRSHSSIVFLLVASACNSRAPLPALPEVATGGFAPAARQQVEAAIADARAHPNQADAVGKLGMVLHAYDLRGPAAAAYRRAAALEPERFDWKYYLGLVSDGAAAADAFRAALKLRDYPPARLKLGEALLALGDSAGASAVLRDIAHPAAWFGYGRATGDASYYEKALEAFPEYGAAMFSLAQHHQRAGRSQEAAELMRRYEKHRLTAPVMDDPLLDAIRALNQGADRLLRSAAVAESQGDLRSAIDLHLKALALDPKHVQAHVDLISLYARVDDSAGAERHYREALKLAPNSDGAYYNFGVLCFRSGRIQEAQAAFKRTVELNPGNADAHNNLGVILERQGKLNEAAVQFRRAIDSRPDLRLAHFHLGRILTNQRRFGEAIEHLQRAASVDDEATPTYLYALGATVARSGDAAKAYSILATARDKAAGRGQTQLAEAIARDLGRLRK